jgi:4-hydroxybenzoate polyprenyltransferase
MLFSLFRVKHWVKNLFVFLPAFFGGVLLEVDILLALVLAFVSFCLVSSSIYILNDLQDIELDKLHPVKSKRPIPSGIVSISTAWLFFVALSAIGLGLSYYVNPWFFVVVLIYFVNNLFYSFGAKNYSIVDIVMVASGFLLRVIGGGVVSDVILYKWLLAITFLLALFLVIAKRRDDLLLTDKTETIRKASKKYNLEFINGAMLMVATLLVVCYIMYTFGNSHYGGEDDYFIFSSSLFVLIGILRYFQIVYVEQNSGAPTELLYTDRFLQVVIASWVILFIMSIYF